MERIELEIKNAKDRADVASVLVDNGYRVWTERVKKGTRAASTTILCADKAGRTTDETDGRA